MPWRTELERGAACALLTVLCGCGAPSGEGAAKLMLLKPGQTYQHTMVHAFSIE